MTISSILFLHFIFLGLFNGCLSSNPETILVEDYIPEDNEEITGEMQMEDLSPDSEIVMVQSQEDNNERTGKVQEGDLSSNPKSVTIQSQEEIKMQKMQIIKFQMEDVSTIPESVTEQSQEKNIERTGQMQMEDPFINPESAMIQSQEGNNEKIGRMQMEDASNNANRGIYIGGVRSYSPYSGWNQRGVPREPNYERTDRNENVTPFPTAWTNSRYPQPNSRPPNKVNRNNNNNRGNSRPINSSPVTTEEFFYDKNPENVVTKSPGRCRNDPNFFASLVNTFAFELVETLNLESNFVISPLSIFVALSMCYLGSSGKTKAQMEQAFGMADCQLAEEDIHQGIKNLLPLVLRETPGYELFVANGLFLGKDFRANAQFEEDVKRYYDAELENLDFGNPDSLKFINDWVTKNTRNMITSIISRPPNSLTRLILLNAVFFKGIWKMQFPPSKTYNGNFHTLDRNEKPVS